MPGAGCVHNKSSTTYPTVPIQYRMNPRPLLWFLPVLAGAAAYSLTPGPPTDTAAMRSSERPRSKEPASPIIARLEDFETQLREFEAESNKPVPQSLTAADLKEQILQLREKLGPSSPAAVDRRRLWRLLNAAESRLGEMGGDHLDWMKEHHPEGVLRFMAAWADKDPAAVLGYIKSSGTFSPCTHQTLMSVLGRLGSVDPGSFLETVKSVPWDRFLFPHDSLSRMQVASAEEVPLWVESGAARLLLEQGVPVYGLFTPWAKQDPAGALQAWNEWGDPRSNASVDALREILAARTVKPENAAELEESFSQLDEASLTRLKTAWTEMEKKRPWAVRELRKKSPLLESWSSPATTVPDP